MAYEMVVGLQIKDDKVYSEYRNAMTPILNKFGGGFRYDFKVNEVLKNDEGRNINRVFIIHFKDKQSMNSFFSDEDYLKAKEQYFSPSVEETTIISEYERA